MLHLAPMLLRLVEYDLLLHLNGSLIHWWNHLLTQFPFQPTFELMKVFLMRLKMVLSRRDQNTLDIYP